MKLVCNKDILYDALFKVSKAVAQNSSISALEGVKISVSETSAVLTGYNLSLGIKKEIEVSSDGSADFIVKASLFMEIVKRMPNEKICLEIDENNNIFVESGAAQCSIPARNAAEYPDIPDFETSQVLTIPHHILKNMINQTIFSVSQDTKKPILTGELFDYSEKCLRLVALDNFKLAVRKEDSIDATGDFKVIIPSKALSEVEHILSDDEKEVCTLKIGDKHACFTISGYNIYSRLLEGEFFNYKNSIPKTFATEIEISTRELRDSLERCALIVEDKLKNPIRCRLCDGILRLACATPQGKVNDEIKAAISGNKFEIGVNSKYFLDAIKATETDRVKICMNTPVSPIVITPLEGDSFTFLVLPIQLIN